MKNAAALEAIADEDFQTELGQFNVEINIPPRLLSQAIASSSRPTSGAISTTPRSAPARSARTW